MRRVLDRMVIVAIGFEIVLGQGVEFGARAIGQRGAVRANLARVKGRRIFIEYLVSEIAGITIYLQFELQ